MSDITSRPYQIDRTRACEFCCFGHGDHSPWCDYGKEWSLVRERHLRALQLTPEEKQIWPHGSWSVDAAMPKGEIGFISQRKEIAPGVLEPEDEWAKRCALIVNLKETE